MFTIPGWFILSVSEYWKKWAPLQRWILAISISIAFYPVLFYFSRLLLPNLHIGLNKLMLLGAFLLITIVIREYKNYKIHFHFDKYEYIAVGFILLTLLTRFLMLSTHPNPAWTDSLHHSLITKLVALNGQLPYTLEPYEPVSLSMYHLGLYSITGTYSILSNVPAHTSLQWIAQVLNGLCGIGIYLFLDKYVNRKSAIVGLIVAGLFSFQPNWYFNWGRFTQLSAQVLFGSAMLINFEAIANIKKFEKKSLKTIVILLASFLNAGIFLLHFRVAIFYFLFILVIVIFELINSCRESRFFKFIANLGSITLLSLILISPSIVQAFIKYLSLKSIQTSVGQGFDISYYYFPFSTYFSLGLPVWLFIFTIFFLILGLFKKNVLIWKIFIWVGSLLGLGYLYLMNIPFLMVTNLGAIIIMLYIPTALIIGVGYSEIIKITPSKATERLFHAFIIAGLLFGYVRVFDIEESRFFISDEDLKTMSWINDNTPISAKFGINTIFWLKDHPHGIDSGYWIPYFTGRTTNTGTMLFNIGSKTHAEGIVKESLLVEKFYKDFDANILHELCFSNINYLHIKNVNNERELLTMESLGLVSIEYHENNTWIIALICK
jgi:hypothetical protein